MSTLADKLLALHGDPESTAYGNDDLWQAAAKLREMERNERRTALVSVGAAPQDTAKAAINAMRRDEGRWLPPDAFSKIVRILKVLEGDPHVLATEDFMAMPHLRMLHDRALNLVSRTEPWSKEALESLDALLSEVETGEPVAMPALTSPDMLGARIKRAILLLKERTTLNPIEYGSLISLFQLIEGRANAPLVAAPSMLARLSRAHALLRP